MGSSIPCDQVLVSQCDFQNCDAQLLEKTLKEMGFTNVNRSGATLYFRDAQGNSCNIGYGKLSMQNGEQREVDALATKIKGQFNQNAVKEAARRQGWKVVTGTDGKIKQVVRRRK